MKRGIGALMVGVAFGVLVTGTALSCGLWQAVAIWGGAVALTALIAYGLHLMDGGQ